MNGATEATLQDLLRAAEARNVTLEKILAALTSGAGGGGGGGAASGGLAGIAKSAGPASAALSALGTVVGGVGSLIGSVLGVMGNILGKVVTGLTDTARHLKDLAIQAAEGTVRMSELFNAFRDLPFFLGNLASLFSGIIGYYERQLDVYVKLTQSGASFSGSLDIMRAAAAKSNLTLSEFSSVVSANSEVFAMMGDTVQGGITRFADAQSKLMGPGSKYYESIIGLGVTNEQAAKYMTSTIIAQGYMNNKQKLTTEQLAAQTYSYIVQLDTLSKLTGKRKEQVDEEVRRYEQQGKVQAYLATLSVKEKEAAQAKLAEAQVLGDDYVEELFNSMRGIDVPVSQAMSNFAAATGGASIEAIRQIAALQGSREEVAAQARKIQAGLTNQYASMIQAGGPQMQFVLEQAGMLNDAAIKYNLMIKNQTAATSKDAEAAAERAKQEEGQAKIMLVGQQKLRFFGNAVSALASELFGNILVKLEEFGVWITDRLTGKVEDATSWLTDIGNVLKPLSDWFGQTFENLKNAKTGEFWSTLSGQISSGFEQFMNSPLWLVHIKPAIDGLIDKIKSVLMPAFESMIQMLGDAMNAWMWKYLPGAQRFGIAEDPIMRKAREDYESATNKYKELNAQWTNFNKSPASMEDKNAMYKTVHEAFQKSLDATTELKKLEAADRKKAQERQAAYSEWESEAQGVPARASGGPINAGTYLVGEKGPELITSQSSGHVITNENLTSFMANAGNMNSNMLSAIQTMNAQNKQMLAVMQTIADYSKKSNSAIRGLNGDAFA
jgi:hypothetical protein